MFKLFAGSSNQNLSQKIAKLSNLDLSKSRLTRFDNSEIKVTIKENVNTQKCVVIQSTSNPTDTHLMELFFFADALKRSGADKIIAVIPYFGYARQNREHQKGESVSANVVIRFLESIGYNEIFTVDLHDEATEGIFTVPFKNISALPLLAKTVKKYIDTDNAVVVSPDQGGVERARNFSIALFENKKSEIVVVEKKRNLEKIHQSQALDLYGDVKNKSVILVDDIITSGNTLINAAELCLSRGAKTVFAAVTHHDFAPGTPLTLQQSPISKVFTTDSIELKPKEQFDKLQVISIAQLIAGSLIDNK